MRTRGKQGFTLMELLVVIAIIGLLVAILMPATVALRRRALATQATAEMRALKTAILTYQAETGRWPADSQTETTIQASRQVIPRLRPPQSPQNKIFWTGGDRVVNARNQEYQVRINPWGTPPIGDVNDKDAKFTVSFIEP